MAEFGSGAKGGRILKIIPNDRSLLFEAQGLAANVINGTDGNDSLDGTDGDDVLAGGSGADTLNGEAGNDELYAGEVSPYWQAPSQPINNFIIAPLLDTGTEVDTLNGGSGFDRIFAGFGDHVDGGADGAELLISLAGATSGVTANFSSLDNGGMLTIGGGTITNINLVRWIEGTNFDDTITGSNGDLSYATIIYALGGHDHIVAGENTGNIYGGSGNDTIDSMYGYWGYYGEDGDDVINVTTTTDASFASGGIGNDRLTLAGTAHGGAGDDTIIATINTYALAAYGDSGNDRVTGRTLGDVLSGGDGADVIDGRGGDDLLMSGGTSQDIYPGTDLRERADFGSEHDVVTGGVGDDTLFIGYGDDADGGTGNNTLWLSLSGASSGITLDTASLLTGELVQLGGGTITNIQEVAGLFGSGFGDVLTLSTEGTIEGMGGDDTLNGSSGHDEIYGGAGADMIDAGADDDTIWIEGNGDVAPGEWIDGGAGNDALFVGPNNSYEPGGHISLAGVTLTGIETLSQTIGTIVGVTQAQISSLTTIFADLYFTEAGAISLSGISSHGRNLFELNEGGNQLDFSGFTVTLEPSFRVQGGDSADTVIASSAYVNFMGNGGNDLLHGGDGYSYLDGAAGNDTLIAGTGADGLSGGWGNDTLIGSAADLNSSLFLDFSAGDRIIVTDASLTDFSFSLTGNTLIYTGGSLELGFVPSETVVATAAAGGGVQLTLSTNATAADDSLIGTAAPDNLKGLGGNDVLDGLGSDDALSGDGGNDTLNGGEGNDILDGGIGRDTMAGGAGDDVYYVDRSDDVTTEAAGQGIDTVLSAVSWALGANFENLTLTGTADRTGKGNGLANVLTGNSGANDLYGFGEADTLFGNGGNDLLDGGAGADAMNGGMGDDLYKVDNAEDMVDELGGNGVDLVRSSVTFTLASGVENLILIGAGSINGTGNELNNAITGNSLANAITGGAGYDQLSGFGGNDTLDGGEHDDLLNGGAGRDVMAGGAGHDTYVVDRSDDVTSEAADSGTDTVISAVSWALDANLENLTLTGGAERTGKGNALANILTGNAGANELNGMGGADTLVGNGGNDLLDGGAGADSMSGGAGDDLYKVDDAGDTVSEEGGTGTDLVRSSVSFTLGAGLDDLTLIGTGAINGTGNDLDNVITGNSLANVITGGAGADQLGGFGGADLLDGGAGRDSLTGGVGGDTFRFDELGDFAGLDELTCDLITLFNQVEGDTIDLTGLDADTLADGDQAFAFIGTAGFGANAGELRYALSGGDTHVIGDLDGDGQADFMIRLGGSETLQASDFAL